MTTYSFSPDQKMYQIPNRNATKKEIIKINMLCEKQKKRDKKIVVIQGLGFVGAVMGALVADCEIENKSKYFVIGIDLPSQDSFWKIATINKGNSPYKAKDPEVEKIFKRTILNKKTFLATWISEAYSEADIIIVDINLDVDKTIPGKVEETDVSIANFKKAMVTIGKYMNKEALVLIETTVPPGTVENVIKPILEKCFRVRNIDLKKNPILLAHSYERVMPGENYIDSIKKINRTFSAVNKKALNKTREFLNDIIDTKNHPLWELDKPLASEIAKILENSYRAVNIAFMYEWTLFAEDIGVNLFEIVDSIKVRKGTHDNMRYPGFGVGGYCLPKDPLLAEWASKYIFKRKKHLNFSIDAVKINDLMPHHTYDLLMKGLNYHIKGKKITILGASYRKDVDDTRNSPTILLYDDIINSGGKPKVHDPYAISMFDRKDIRIESDIDLSLANASAVIFVVDHAEYVNLSMKKIIKSLIAKACIVDGFNVLSDDKLYYLKKRGFSVLGVGKGHIKNF